MEAKTISKLSDININLYEIQIVEKEQPPDKYHPEQTVYVASNVLQWAMEAAAKEAIANGIDCPKIRTVSNLGDCLFLNHEVRDIIESEVISNGC